MTATAKVLNGEVQAGDTIAYSTRTGSYQDMTIGTVAEVTEASTWGSPVHPVLKVRPTLTSGYHVAPFKIVTLTSLDRVVKMPAASSPELAAHVEWLTEMRGSFLELLAVSHQAQCDAEDEDQYDSAEAVTVATAGALSFLTMCLDRLAA
jgi:hypothetical protein